MKDKEKPAGRVLKHEEFTLWARFTRDIQAYRKDLARTDTLHASPESGEVLPGKHDREKQGKSAENQPAAAPLPVYGLQGADKKTAQKLRRGKIPIEGRLDLHGLNQIEAYEALFNFLKQAQQQEKRCVLIITGKGKERTDVSSWLEPARGVLREQFPKWMAEPRSRSLVLDYCSAKPRDGGGGAWYVLLRKKKV